ncbi:1-acyl-sn-glycerol-3-phosphate acyltransferase, partial [Listeria monocytogenes]|nr:1-acyl-sn-glycerol-3-phosphate acyltransferase [Listeria monocytogenes]
RFGDPVLFNDTELDQKELLEVKSQELMATFEQLQNEINQTKNK